MIEERLNHLPSATRPAVKRGSGRLAPPAMTTPLDGWRVLAGELERSPRLPAS